MLFLFGYMLPDQIDDDMLPDQINDDVYMLGFTCGYIFYSSSC